MPVFQFPPRAIWLLLVIIFMAGLGLFSVPSSQAQTIPPATAPAVYLPLINKSVPNATPMPTVTKTPVPATATKTPLPATPTKTPTVTPVSQVVSIKSSRAFTIPFSTSLYVVGEISNATASAVYLVKIQAKFFDSAHQLVAVESGYTYLTMTAPGKVNPFRLILFNAPNSIASYELTLTYQEDGGLDYRQIAVLSQQVRDDFGVEVFGELRNDAEAPVRPPQAAVTFYDAAGNVLNTESTYTSGDLAKGQTTIYSISTFSDFTYASYVVQAQSYLVP